MAASPSLRLLQALLPYLERFEAERPAPDTDLRVFAIWLQQQVPEPDHGMPAASPAAATPIPLESMLFRHIVQIFRVLKQEIKAASTGLPINHLDEFGLLMEVIQKPGIRKIDLVNHNRMETSSGNDMINRLIRAGYLHERPDPQHRRYRRLHITENGMNLVRQLLPHYNLVAQRLAQPLAQPARTQLVALLAQIDAIHTADSAAPTPAAKRGGR